MADNLTFHVRSNVKKGLPNTCKTETKRVSKAKKRLEARTRDWEATRNLAAHEHHRPGSMKHR